MQSDSDREFHFEIPRGYYGMQYFLMCVICGPFIYGFYNLIVHGPTPKLTVDGVVVPLLFVAWGVYAIYQLQTFPESVTITADSFQVNFRKFQRVFPFSQIKEVHWHMDEDSDEDHRQVSLLLTDNSIVHLPVRGGVWNFVVTHMPRVCPESIKLVNTARNVRRGKSLH